jgi:chromosomal replication initiation ATPase DnaA
MTLENELRERGLWLLVERVARNFNLLPEEVISKRRDRAFVRARQVIYTKLISEGYSFAAVGRMFRRDHTTVLHALKSAP